MVPVSAVLNSLTLMLYLLVPWTALNLVDFFFVRRGHYAITDIFRPDGVYGAWGWRGLTAYFVGFAAEIPFMNLPPIAGLSYKGYFPAHVTNGVDYAWLVGLAVAGIAYFLLSRSLDLAAEQAAIEASERELLAIDVAEAAALGGQAPGDVQAPSAGAPPGGAQISSRRRPGVRTTRSWDVECHDRTCSADHRRRYRRAGGRHPGAPLRGRGHLRPSAAPR